LTYCLRIVHMLCVFTGKMLAFILYYVCSLVKCLHLSPAAEGRLGVVRVQVWPCAEGARGYADVYGCEGRAWDRGSQACQGGPGGQGHWPGGGAGWPGRADTAARTGSCTETIEIRGCLIQLEQVAALGLVKYMAFWLESLIFPFALRLLKYMAVWLESLIFPFALRLLKYMAVWLESLIFPLHWDYWTGSCTGTIEQVAVLRVLNR